MGQLEVFSPAKINLFLSVLGRLETGFHELASLVAPVDFGDRIVVAAEPALGRGVTLECSDSSLPTDGRNLAVAAAERFLERFGMNWQVRLQLEKRIPHGAGLGGGSSNASSVLDALARLAAEQEGREIGRGELESLAAELGSDCPLFLRKGPVVMRGRGERLSDLEATARGGLSGRPVLLFKPSFAIGTAWAYGALAACREAYDGREWAEGRIATWSAGDLPLEAFLHNTFERVVYPKYPAFETLFQRLRGLGLHPVVSGSGSCCFAFLGDEASGEGAISEVAEAWGVRSFCRVARIL